MDRTGLEFHFVFAITRTVHSVILTTFSPGATVLTKRASVLNLINLFFIRKILHSFLVVEQYVTLFFVNISNKSVGAAIDSDGYMTT